MVFDSSGAVLAHQRASWKDIWPSRWDLAFGGVCAVGEPWDDAASRELAEEAGIVAPLRELSKVEFDSDETQGRRAALRDHSRRTVRVRRR